MKNGESWHYILYPFSSPLWASAIYFTSGTLKPSHIHSQVHFIISSDNYVRIRAKRRSFKRKYVYFVVFLEQIVLFCLRIVIMIIITVFKYYTVSVWGQLWHRGTKCDCRTDWLWVQSPFEEMKYLLKLIFPFLCSGVEAKGGVEFCHSTSNIRQKVRNGVT